MSFEAAVRLKDPNVVRLLEKTILKIADQCLLIRGTDILWRIEQDIGRPIGAGIIYDLIEGGVLVKRRSSKSIEDYLFEVECKKIQEYFDKEVMAAEIIQILDKKTSAASSLSISFAATVPDTYADAAEGFEEIYPALIRIAAEATHDLWIINPFFDIYGAQSLIPSLIGAAKNGVNIHILGRRICDPQDQGFDPSVGCIASAFVKKDLVNKIEIRDFFRQDESGRLIYGLHSKMMIADKLIAYIGSANITKHSLRSNFEIGVILKGRGIEPLLTITGALWSESTIIDPKYIATLVDE
jgi:phosphatidylserine/phosphatidylglycerophosphate/cardiolipin synthase-like enzyme